MLGISALSPRPGRDTHAPAETTASLMLGRAPWLLASGLGSRDRRGGWGVRLPGAVAFCGRAESAALSDLVAPSSGPRRGATQRAPGERTPHPPPPRRNDAGAGWRPHRRPAFIMRPSARREGRRTHAKERREHGLRADPVTRCATASPPSPSNRPDKLNALDRRDGAARCAQAMDEATRDETVRVIVLTGARARLSARGADMQMLSGIVRRGHRPRAWEGCPAGPPRGGGRRTRAARLRRTLRLLPDGAQADHRGAQRGPPRALGLVVLALLRPCAIAADRRGLHHRVSRGAGSSPSTG